jgi:hypothetical protein
MSPFNNPFSKEKKTKPISNQFRAAADAFMAINEESLNYDFKLGERAQFLDVIREIINSGFSENSIRKGLEHHSPDIRMFVQKYLQEFAKRNV